MSQTNLNVIKIFICFRVCQKNGVARPIVNQSSLNSRKILISGDRATHIQDKLEKELRRSGAEYIVVTREKKSPVYIEHCSLRIRQEQAQESANVRTGPRFNGEWAENNEAKCEIVVSADARSTEQLLNEEPEKRELFAVIPAHATTDNGTMTYVKEMDWDIRRRMQEEATQQRYIGVERETRLESAVHFQHPPLVAYRSWAVRQGESIAENQDDEGIQLPVVESMGNQEQPTTRDCPKRFEQCPSEKMCPHMFANDIALLKLNFKCVAEFLSNVRTRNRRDVIDVSLEASWTALTRPGRRISVGNFQGVVAPPPHTVSPDADGHYAFPILFSLPRGR